LGVRTEGHFIATVEVKQLPAGLAILELYVATSCGGESFAVRAEGYIEVNAIDGKELLTAL